MKKVLVLGGTGEARAIVDSLCARYGSEIRFIYSLAGVTETPRMPTGAEVITGGFGGREGLEAYLKKTGICAVIDATHPFAATMTRNAYDAASSLDVPILQIERELWEPEEGDEWAEVADMESAAFYLPRFGTRCMLAIGSRELHLFSKRSRTFFLVRAITHSTDTGSLPFDNYSLVVDTEIRDVDGEKALMEEYKIDVLVCRNSGGASTAAKLLVARQLKIPVIIVKRPPSIGGDVAYNTDDLIEWCEGVF